MTGGGVSHFAFTTLAVLMALLALVVALLGMTVARIALAVRSLAQIMGAERLAKLAEEHERRERGP